MPEVKRRPHERSRTTARRGPSKVFQPPNAAADDEREVRKAFQQLGHVLIGRAGHGANGGKIEKDGGSVAGVHRKADQLDGRSSNEFRSRHDRAACAQVQAEREACPRHGLGDGAQVGRAAQRLEPDDRPPCPRVHHRASAVGIAHACVYPHPESQARQPTDQLGGWRKPLDRIEIGQVAFTQSQAVSEGLRECERLVARNEGAVHRPVLRANAAYGMNSSTAPDVEDGDHAHLSTAPMFVHEFASGGGFAGLPIPEDLLQQGASMLRALSEDLASSGAHRLVTTRDSRVSLELPPRIEAIPVAEGCHTDVFRALARAAEHAWIIAPESGDRLARLTVLASQLGPRVIGSNPAAVRLVSDKLALARLLANWGVAAPRTWPASQARVAVREVGFPLVVKPRRGAGCEGVNLARDSAALAGILAVAAESVDEVVVQEYVPGCAASVSLLCADGRARPLSLNAQDVRPGVPFSYLGGWVPLAHAAAAEALEASGRLCERIPGLRGYVGVDLILSPSHPHVFVIEVNPRLTTSYIGLRAAANVNLAEQVLRAVRFGELPDPPRLERLVHFSATGAVERSAF